MKSIIGHRNPDTDTICSAIAYRALLADQGVEAKVFALGEANKETKFVLEKFGVDFPEIVSELPKDSEIILIDHNEKAQSIENLNELDVVEIVDHHKADIKTDKPIRIHMEPLGSSCSIVAKKFIVEGVEIPQEIAQILVAGIISDTLFFRSPTATPEDRELMEKLNEVAKIEDLEVLSMGMFDAKSDLGDLSTEDLVKLDYKQFDFSGHKFGIGVMETTNKDFGLGRKDEMTEVLSEIKKNEGVDGVIFSIIDILNEEAYTFCSDEEVKKIFAEAFSSEDRDGVLYNKGMVSRKKQTVPGLENHFRNL